MGQRKTYADPYAAHCGNCDLDYTANVQSAVCPHWSLGDPREAEQAEKLAKGAERRRRRRDPDPLSWGRLLQGQRQWVADLEKLRDVMVEVQREGRQPEPETAEAIRKTDIALEHARAAVETLEALADVVAPEGPT